MSPPLHMLKLEPDMRKLAAWAHARRFVGRDGDLGYALHAALAAIFGDNAPKPFRFKEPTPSASGGAVVPALYGYCQASVTALREHAELAEPDLHAALGLDTLATKPMPTTWAPGRTLDFEVRVRPVIRCDRTGDRTRVRERDAFLAALPAGATTPSDPILDRETVYRTWLIRELGREGAAGSLTNTLRMTAFQRTRVQRRGRSVIDGRRPFHAPEGPDAVFIGTLRVEDGEAFESLVRRGVGRHRSFGFGMLLLRPARARTGC